LESDIDAVWLPELGPHSHAFCLIEHPVSTYTIILSTYMKASMVTDSDIKVEVRR
jgi:hypothetical protein